MPEQQVVDPGAQLVRRVRLMMIISGATTLIALAVILAVIGYRVFRNEGSGAPNIEATIILPKGARLVSTAVSGDRVAVTVDLGGALEIRTFDLKTLKPAGRLKFGTEP